MNFPPASSIAALQRQSPLDALETRILLCHVTGLTRMQLITHDEQLPTPEQTAAFRQLIQRRVNGEPIAYLIGQREFYGLMLQVTPDVLIPRPETELLVELAMARLPQRGRVMDMGTGSGAIAVAIAHGRPDADVTALDVSAAALAVASRNAALHLPAPAKPVNFIESNWYSGLSALHSFDMIVANPPYIVAGDEHLSQGDLRFEPVDALTDHADGMAALKTIVSGATTHLAGDGWLLMEHGYDQAAAVRVLLQQAGFCEVQSWRDLAGIERVSGGRRPL
jgi:release factor glutamine methyltransferase